MRRSVVHIVKLSFVEHLPWCVDVQVNANGVNSLPNRESTGYRLTNASENFRNLQELLSFESNI